MHTDSSPTFCNTTTAQKYLDNVIQTGLKFILHRKCRRNITRNNRKIYTRSEKQMILNYKYRLYVNKHTEELSQLVTTSIYVWNHIVALYRRYYKLYKTNPSCGKMQHHIAKLAKNNEYWSKMGSQSLHGKGVSHDRSNSKTSSNKEAVA